MSEELKPCPFCGSDDIETFYNRSGVDHYTCQYCGATAKQWNTRHEPYELPEWLIKEVRAQIDAIIGIRFGGRYSNQKALKRNGWIEALEWVLSLRKPENK